MGKNERMKNERRNSPYENYVQFPFREVKNEKRATKERKK